MDIDYEDLACFIQHPDICIDWLVKLVKTLHTTLHSPLITISPLAPWYSPRVYDRAFLKLNEKVGDIISWFNIQYYNQGNDAYTDCNSLFTDTSSKSDYTSKTSVAALIEAGLDPNKIVIGKPATRADASNGFMDDHVLADCLREFPRAGELGGLMKWQFKNDPKSELISIAADGFE